MEMLMDKQELLDLGEALLGVRIVCREGQLWITQCGDSRDHILHSGGSFIVRAKGRVIITASQASRLILTESKESDKLQQPLRAIYSVLRNCMASSLKTYHS